MMLKRSLLVAATATLALAACGSSKSSSSASSAAPSSAAASATTAAGAAGATTTAAGGATAAAGTEVDLKEWSVTAPAIKAGAVTLTVKNNGNNPHELKIIKADSFDSLPKADGGAVDESKLDASAIVGKTPRIGGGQSTTLSVTLPAGKYVFVCNLGNGAQSHAAKGQHADVTVS